jgi:hypothetical protein
MTITPVDTQRNLFKVADMYPQELLTKFLTTDHLATPYRKEQLQDNWPRRRLMNETEEIYMELDAYVKQQLSDIEQAIGVELMACDTGFWLDEAGFCMEKHLDNEGVRVSMQVYLNENLLDLGTAFHNPDGSIRYKPEYIINTGYIMINGPEQYHSMTTRVPDDSYRISSYTWLYPKA